MFSVHIFRFECSICGQKFAQRYNMTSHYNTHQGIHRPQSRNYKCVLCMEAFPRREKLNKHLRQVHDVSDDDIKKLAEKNPNSDEAVRIIERLKANMFFAKEEIVIEYIDACGEAGDGDDADNLIEDEIITADE